MKYALLLGLTACGTPAGTLGPTVTILEPADGARPAEGLPTHLVVQVDDPGTTLPVKLIVSSDVDHVLLRTDALSVPITFAADIQLRTVSAHLLTVQAVDTAGQRAEDTVRIDVNAAPSAPGVTVTPSTPAAGDALTAEVTTLARDASPLGYAWTWFRDDAPYASGDGRRATVDAGIPQAGEVWRARFEAFEKLGENRDPDGTSSFGEASVTVSGATDTDPG